jgi:Holliday junction resolvase RusA-like endonuclease
MGGHWAVAARRKKADAQMIAVYGRNVPKAAGKRRVELEIILKPRHRGGDVDSYWKSTLDGLKRAGLIVDDNRQHCEISQPTYSRGTETNWGTVIRLTDIP